MYTRTESRVRRKDEYIQEHFENINVRIVSYTKGLLLYLFLYLSMQHETRGIKTEIDYRIYLKHLYW
jgi:hypothetical protein